ncbi:MFS transporter [Microbacterium sp. 10M-3C3]|uniref:MFS transporter n=1 Tax=Microbacterium sp. 10M-3C3 TaxID=2483401 RepID=UPI0013DE1AEB|nr:MFS transporter [Microbacterium sp. 10M-3C3]
MSQSVAAAPASQVTRWTPRQRLATALNLTGALTVAGAAGAGSPLFVYEQGRWGFGESTLTIMFSIYALTLLVTLLVAGSLSDHLGRRPVLIGALLLLAAASVLFLLADDASWLILARAVQGVATGAATSAFTAMVSETVPSASRDRMTQIAGSFPIGGLALGALAGGLAVQGTALPVVAVFVPVIVLIAVAISGSLLTPASSSRIPGAWRSLVPRVAVPRRLRGAFARAAVLVAAAWATSGLFLGLVPAFAHAVGVDGLPAAVLVFLQPATAAAAGIALTRLPAARAGLVGATALLAGGALAFAAAVGGSAPLMALAAIVGGVGNGLGFAAALRPLAAAAATHERGGVISAIYVVAYVAYGLPAFVAGQLAADLGLAGVTAGYALLIVAAAAAALLTRVPLRADSHPVLAGKEGRS